METNEVLSLVETGNLSKNDTLLLMSKIIGYRYMPPTIDEFIEDDYYCGRFLGKHVFNHWREFLRQIFPDPIRSPFPYICLTGCLGAGKSTVTKICEMYLDCKLDHLENFDFASLADTKGLYASFFHNSKAKAHSEFIQSIVNMRGRSPYFTQGRLNGVKMGMVADGPIGNATIGLDVLFYAMSEVNFVKRSVSEFKITQAHQRNKSRYLKIMGYFPLIILDSSASTTNSVVDDFINNNPYEGVLVDRSSIWEAKKELGIYFNKGSFYVYKGDSQNRPHIIESGEDISTLDKDRILECPNELKPDFQANLIQSLMDMAGVSVSSAENFVEDANAIDRQCNLHDYLPEPIYVEFSDLNDDIYSKVEHAIRILPKDKIIFIALDAAITNDLYSIAIGYCERLFEVPNEVENNYNRIFYPVVNIPIVFGVSRYVTQYTSITHVEKFIVDLRDKGWEIGAVTCDQYQSEQLIQDLLRIGIRTYKISTDRNDVPYTRLKDGMYRGLVYMPNSLILRGELKGLKRINNKIDRQREAINGITTHKDFSDAVCRLYTSVLDNRDLAMQLPSNSSMETQLKVTEELKSYKKSVSDTIENMLKSIYG